MSKYHILNTIMIGGGIAAIIKILHVSVLLTYVPMIALFILIFGALFAKTYVKKSEPQDLDPLLQSRIPRAAFLLSMSVLMVAILLKIMHWPGDYPLFIADAALQLMALILSYVIKPGQGLRKENMEILDDQ